MNKPADDELLASINNATGIEAVRSVVEQFFTMEFPPLSENPSAQERYDNADGGRVVFEDLEPIARMPIRVCTAQMLTVVYQDIEDGGIYPCENGGEPYDDEVQDALVEQGQAFSGEGFDRDPRPIVAFLLGSGASDAEIIRRSDIPEDVY